MTKKVSKTAKEKAPARDAGNAVRVKNFALVQMAKWLSVIVTNPGDPEKTRTVELALHGPKARARNKIHKLIVDRAQAVEQERMAIVRRYAKDVDPKTGDPVTNPETGRYDLDETKRPDFEKEYMDLMSELSVFDVLPSNQADWRVARAIIVDELKSELTVEDGVLYEDVCAALEAASL